MSSDGLTADQQNALDDAYRAQRELRALYGGGRQDLKTIQECGELAAAASNLSRALAQRLGHYVDGGERGAVDDELADVLQLVLGAMPPDSPAWARLRVKTGHVRQLIEEAARG